MTFTSNIFLIGLLPWFILLFYLLKNFNESRKILILLMNTIFYIFGGIGTFAFICGSSFIVWVFCLILRKNKNKVIYGMICVISLIPLLAMKYTGFVISNINQLFNYNIKMPGILIPIGISFFTFEAVSCLCDVYTDKIKEKVELIDIYICIFNFFPYSYIWSDCPIFEI